MKAWVATGRLPMCSLRTALTHYLNITSTPSQNFLHMLSLQATCKEEIDTLLLLSKVRTIANSNWHEGTHFFGGGNGCAAENFDSPVTKYQQKNQIFRFNLHSITFPQIQPFPPFTTDPWTEGQNENGPHVQTTNCSIHQIKTLIKSERRKKAYRSQKQIHMPTFPLSSPRAIDIIRYNSTLQQTNKPYVAFTNTKHFKG